MLSLKMTIQLTLKTINKKVVYLLEVVFQMTPNSTWAEFEEKDRKKTKVGNERV